MTQLKGKPCNADGCNNPRWSAGFCSYHQNLRTDEKYKRSQELSRQNLNKGSSFTKSSSPPRKKKPSKILRNYRKSGKSDYKQVYFDYFGYDYGEFIPCEVCGAEAVDIHHIEARGMGGDPTKSKDTIDNLMAVCRNCHEIYGDLKVYMDLLKQIHNKHVKNVADKK